MPKNDNQTTKNDNPTTKNDNKKFVVRSDRAGVFFGVITKTMPLGDKLYVEMDECRRIHYWNGAASLTQVALDGLPKGSGSRITNPLDGACVAGVIEILPCTKKATSAIEELQPWTI
jgi:hypothetical protein